jgi:hypothetical protein
VRVGQFAYFALHSPSVSAEEMTARLGLEPDESSIRGSRTPVPPRPAAHAWMVVCRERGLTVDEQIDQIMRRLRPHRDSIAALSRELAARDPGQAGAVLEVVRDFDDPDGEEEQLSPPDAYFQKLAGQHQLLGWSLDGEVLEFLVATGAHLDVDEYG